MENVTIEKLRNAVLTYGTVSVEQMLEEAFDLAIINNNWDEAERFQTMLMELTSAH